MQVKQTIDKWSSEINREARRKKLKYLDDWCMYCGFPYTLPMKWDSCQYHREEFRKLSFLRKITETIKKLFY